MGLRGQSEAWSQQNISVLIGSPRRVTQAEVQAWTEPTSQPSAFQNGKRAASELLRHLVALEKKRKDLNQQAAPFLSTVSSYVHRAFYSQMLHVAGLLLSGKALCSGGLCCMAPLQGPALMRCLDTCVRHAHSSVRSRLCQALAERSLEFLQREQTHYSLPTTTSRCSRGSHFPGAYQSYACSSEMLTLSLRNSRLRWKKESANCVSTVHPRRTI